MSEYTSSVTCSTDPLTSLLDSSKNNDSLSLNDIVEEKKEEEKPKRGRKPLRPTDPIRTKTEEKDKFWLRAFRSYMRKYIDIHWKEFCNDERLFWKYYFSANGKPGKKKRFLSYGKKYKMFLFECQFFKTNFREWFNMYGQSVLENKYKPGTNEWFVYYNYCETELFYYNENKITQASSQPCPIVQQIDMMDDLMNINFDL